MNDAYLVVSVLLVFMRLRVSNSLQSSCLSKPLPKNAGITGRTTAAVYLCGF